MITINYFTIIYIYTNTVLLYTHSIWFETINDFVDKYNIPLNLKNRKSLYRWNTYILYNTDDKLMFVYNLCKICVKHVYIVYIFVYVNMYIFYRK